MSGWLTTATNAFRKKVDAPAQTFEIRCGCGKSLSGERTRAEQTATCPACKSALFVLPASVYPIPRSPVQKKVVRAPRPDEEDETSATATKSTKPDPADVGGTRRRPR